MIHFTFTQTIGEDTTLWFIFLLFITLTFIAYWCYPMQQWQPFKVIKTYNKIRKQINQLRFKLKLLGKVNRSLQKETKHLEAVIETKNQELASHIVHTLQRKKALEKVVAMLQKAQQQEDLSDTKDMLDKLVIFIDNSLRLDENWESSREVFEKLQPQFFQCLQTQFPELNQQDLRFCALLTLNMNDRDMAPLLNIAPKSVKMKRYRLRKKMNVKDEQELKLILSQIYMNVA